MPATRRTLWIVALLTFALPAGGALPAAGLLGDAGSGADAGDDAASAMPLAYGSYQANLTPGDADWFAFPAGSGCFSADVVTAHAMRVTLARGGQTLIEGRPGTDGVFATTIAFSGAPQLAALPDEAPWDAVSVGSYAFGAALAPPSAAGDWPSNDAPGTLASARSVPSTCFSGVFQGDGRDTDVYAFTAGAGELVTYSLATADGRGSARVLDAAGTLVGASIPAGDADQFLTMAAGTHYLVLDGPNAKDSLSYSAALVVGPDPGSSCRPMCFVVS